LLPVAVVAAELMVMVQVAVELVVINLIPINHCL
jgi:hypothetical protein